MTPFVRSVQMRSWVKMFLLDLLDTHTLAKPRQETWLSASKHFHEKSKTSLDLVQITRYLKRKRKEKRKEKKKKRKKSILSTLINVKHHKLLCTNNRREKVLPQSQNVLLVEVQHYNSRPSESIPLTFDQDGSSSTRTWH